MFRRWIAFSIVLLLLVIQSTSKKRKLPPKNPLWGKSIVTDFKRNCSIKRSGLISHILAQHFYPVYKRYNLEVPRQCIFMRERNIYHQIEAGKTELSAGHIKCEFCGKLFLNEDYFNAHVEKKHTKVYVFNKDSVCLSDYCDIFRCDLHERFPINQAEFGLCQKKYVRELQRKCEKIIYTCLPPEMQHYIYDSLSKSLCAPLNCDNFYSDFEDISVWYIAYMLMLIPAIGLLFLLALWCCNEYSNNASEEDIVFRDKYEKERFENTILKDHWLINKIDSRDDVRFSTLREYQQDMIKPIIPKKLAMLDFHP